MSIAAIAIFDIGKTNKKFLLFDEQYQIVYEQSQKFPEITDEDGFPCEDINELGKWIVETFKNILKDDQYEIKALNFSAYGASLVYLDESLKVFLPLYNYLKPSDNKIQEQFYKRYGGKKVLCRETASPSLGNLNSGLQLFALKYQKPEIFAQIKYALHLPQYCSYLVSSKIYSDITAIGCHTHLWDFQKNTYHNWVKEENILEKLPSIQTSDTTTIVSFEGKEIKVGIGMHDSSAALIPYIINADEPFILISTGTWSISLNPFNNSPLTDTELENDCLCYLSYDAKKIKASRLFTGHMHDEQVKRISKHFNKSTEQYSSLILDPSIIKKLRSKKQSKKVTMGFLPFTIKDLIDFSSSKEAYHQLMLDIAAQQFLSTQLIINDTKVRKIYMDGGFSKNEIFMKLLAMQFTEMEVFAAPASNGSALGAALAIHHSWNTNDIPKHLITFKN